VNGVPVFRRDDDGFIAERCVGLEDFSRKAPGD
jgi:hypothetical protein